MGFIQRPGRGSRIRKRPTYPSATRQSIGIGSVLVVIGIFALTPRDVAYRNAATFLLITTLFVTGYSGLRAGIISTLLSFAFFLFIFSLPGSLFHYAPKVQQGLILAAVWFFLFVFVIGMVGGRLRNMGMREYDARIAAEKEALQRQKTEVVLKSTEDLWRLVVDSAMDAIVTFGEDGRILLWNPAAESIFGWKSADVIGKSLAEVILAETFRVDFVEGINSFLASGERKFVGQRFEFFGLGHDGREFPIELSIAPHKSDEGYVFIGFIRDVTDQKRMAERLRQSQKMEAIGTLAGGIAHDFNNILAAVSGNLVLARADLATDSPANEYLLEIEKASTRATQMIRQILTFSSTREAKPEIIDLRSTLADAIKLLRATTPASMEISLVIGDELPHILADSTDLHQIVLNLGINAQHALKDQPGRFEVHATSIVLDEAEAALLVGPTPGRYVRITFADTGCGMDAQTQKRVFEPFFTTKASEGTGLGLSVVYGIVERFGGAITVYSELDKGTIFNIFFPSVSVARDDVVEPVQRDPQKGNGERILYVDDDEALVHMTVRLLKRLNYDVAGYEDPVQALAAFKDSPEAFDLVVTDMSMPKLDGPGLVRELKSIRSDIPIVMVTGYIRPKDLEAARHLGIEELILKPNTIGELGETLHRILEELASHKAKNGGLI